MPKLSDLYLIWFLLLLLFLPILAGPGQRILRGSVPLFYFPEAVPILRSKRKKEEQKIGTSKSTYLDIHACLFFNLKQPFRPIPPTFAISPKEGEENWGGGNFGQNYYQEHEIVYNLKLDFHRPFVLQEQDSLETQSSLSKILFIENREMPILYNPLAFGKKSLQQSWKVFVCRYLPTNKLAFLCVLCDSAVKATNFTLSEADNRSPDFELPKRRGRH